MGGPNATLSPEESVSALRASSGPAQSGRFYNHDGRETPGACYTGPRGTRVRLGSFGCTL